MESAFNLIELAQQNIIRQHEGLTIQQLNKVPEGFNNNIVWNFAHSISSLQMLCYVRAGLQPRLDEKFVAAYKAGTKPEAFVSAEEYNNYKEYAKLGLAKLREDFKANYFEAFKPYATMTGVHMADIDFVVRYLGHHYGVHQGVTSALKKLIA